jgi:REP element-mobilizing transposase RayT
MPHSFTRLYVHIVFSVKNRQPLLTGETLARLCAYFHGVITGENHTLVIAGGAADHVHLLIRAHPQQALADLVRKAKAHATVWARQELPVGRAFAWQSGYAAFSVSQSNVAQVQRYIEGQEAHHRRLSFREELRALLIRHRIEFDDRYL